MKPLVVAVVNGWSASSRRRQTRTCALVERQIQKLDLNCQAFLAMKGSFLRSRSRTLRSFIRDNQRSGRTLVLVGKSYGAKVLVEKVLNQIAEKLDYFEIYLVTVDPCWPIWADLSPNLNGRTLRLTKPISRAVNVYFATKRPRKQAGALLVGPKGVSLMNVPLTDCDHYSIVQHDVTAHVIQKTLKEASK